MNNFDKIKAIFQNSNPLRSEEIQNYLENKASQDERFRVENQMLDDPFTADAVEGLQNSSGQMPSFEFEDFLKKVNPAADVQAAKVRELPARRFVLRRIAAAAAIVVAASLGLFFWSNNDQRLYSQFYSEYESDLVLTLRDDSSSNIKDFDLIKGMEAYDANENTKAIQHFSAYLTKNQNNSDALFYSGLAYLEEGQAEKAYEYLMQAKAADTKKEYARETTWYAALACLKKQDVPRARQLITELLERPGRYFKEAELLHSKL